MLEVPGRVLSVRLGAQCAFGCPRCRSSDPEMMSGCVALLCTSLLVLLPPGAGVPLSVETMKSNVKLMAQTTIVRIQKLTEEFRISPNMVFSGLELIPDIAPDKAWEGLSAIAQGLHSFQVVLSHLPPGDGMAQVHADVLSLHGVVRSLAASLGCPLHKPAGDGRLEAFLKTNSTFHVTIGNVALERLRRFLGKLVQNLDQLKSC
ncbi:leptin-B-like isoform X1 [Anguilla rostrata]|uniref:leptin-B-like isoform X1 n=2 Tax=Anguilla rostrata TaxID=7938 RepID=UPI0030CBEB79